MNEIAKRAGAVLGNPLLWMAVAVVAGAFSQVVPPVVAPYLKAAAEAATGLAALFLHPPKVSPAA